MNRPAPSNVGAIRRLIAAALVAGAVCSGVAAAAPGAGPTPASGARASAPPTTRPAAPAESPAPQSSPTHSPPIPHPATLPGRSATDQRPVRPDPLRTSTPPNETAQTAAESLPAAPAALGFHRVLGALAIVLSLIFALRWLLRRSINPASLPRPSSAVQVLTRSPLSPRQQLLLLRVGRRLLVVSDCNGQLNSLSEITDPDEVAALVGQLRDEKLTSASRSFGNLLGMWRRGGDDSDDTTEADAVNDPEEYPRAAPEVRRRRDPAEHDAGSDAEPAADESDDGSSADSVRTDIHGLLERVRSMSHQFKRE